MSLGNQSRKLTVVIQNKIINQKQLSCSVVREMFCTMLNEMIHERSKPNYIDHNAGEYETFSFWILSFEQCYLLDNLYRGNE